VWGGGSLGSLWSPLQAREDSGENSGERGKLGVLSDKVDQSENGVRKKNFLKGSSKS